MGMKRLIESGEEAVDVEGKKPGRKWSSGRQCSMRMSCRPRGIAGNPMKKRSRPKAEDSLSRQYLRGLAEDAIDSYRGIRK